MKFLKKKNNEVLTSFEFRESIQKAISLLLNSNKSSGDETVLGLFQENGIAKVDSIEILIFLPIAFTRRLFDHLKWHDTYLELDNENNHVEKKFADSTSFQIIWQETEKYFENLPISQNVLRIAGRSAEFKVLNDLLLKNPELKATDINLSKTCIMR